jgi:hypothetical protein
MNQPMLLASWNVKEKRKRERERKGRGVAYSDTEPG